MGSNTGYLIPAVIDPAEHYCIVVPVPKDAGHLAAFWGQLGELGYWYTWERDAAHSGAQLAQVWRRAYNDAYDFFLANGGDCMFCCDDTNELLRRLLACCEAGGAAGDITLIQYRQDVYNTYWDNPVSIHYDAPADTFNSDATDTPEEAARRDSSLCFAITEYIASIIGQAQRNMVIAGVAGSGAAAVIASPYAAAFVSMLSAAAYLAWDYGVFSNSEAIKKVRCCMRASLEGQAVTFDNFKDSVLSCGFADLTAEAQIAYLVNAANQDRTNFLEFVRLLGIGQTAAIVGSVDDCICLEDILDFYFNTDAQGWTVTPAALGDTFNTGQPDNMTWRASIDGIAFGNIYSSGGSVNFGASRTFQDIGAVSAVSFKYYGVAGIGVPYRIRLFDASDTELWSYSGTISGTNGLKNINRTVEPAVSGVRRLTIQFNNTWDVDITQVRLNGWI